VVDEKCNHQIIISLPNTIISRCVIRSAETCGLNALQFSDKATSGETSFGVCMIYQRECALFIKQYTNSDRQGTGTVRAGQHARSLSCLSSNLTDVSR
jgi:hypothetical protein